MKFIGTSNIRYFVRNYFEKMGDLAGKIVIDIPAGSGYMTDVILKKNARVEPYDLFPEFYELDDPPCKKADLNETIPVPNLYADLVLCQEGIEHLPNQLKALREFNRILKPGGKLVLTTPNNSHLRARWSHFLLENELYSRMPINEIDSIWFSDKEDQELYFGHIFLIGIQKLKILAKISGFTITKIHPVKISWGAAVLGVFLPLILITNGYAYYSSMRKNKSIAKEWKQSVYRETLALNLNPNVLFAKHLFVDFIKTQEPSEVNTLFYKKHNQILE